MVLHCFRPSRAMPPHPARSSGSIVSAVVLLVFLITASQASLSSHPRASRRLIEIESHKGTEESQLKNVHLKNLVNDHEATVRQSDIESDKWSEGIESKKGIEGIPVKNVQERNVVNDQGESVWRALSSRVMTISRVWAEPRWPELALDRRTVSAIILAALAAAVSSAAGLGGGVLFVPLLQLLLHFDSKTSVAMSNFMILGSSVVGVGLNLMRDHPTEFNKPLVDFDIALLLQPNMLLGISVGVILNSMLPDWLITALLMVMLVYMTYNTTRSGLKRWDNESRVFNAKKMAKRKTLRRSTTETEKALSESLLGFYDSLSSRYSVKTVLALVFVWLAIFGVQLLRGSRGRQGLLDIAECGVSYWLLTASQVPVAFGVTAWVIYHLRVPEAPPSEPGAPGTSDIQDHGNKVGPKEGFLFSGMALVAGMAAGMLGIGGAMIINPLLLSAGVVPQVAAATSLFMMFFSSSMSSAQYWLMGGVPTGYALIAALICAASSGVGIVILQKIVKKSGRPSLIVFTVAGVIGFSAILMGIFGSQDVWYQYSSGADMGFSYPC